MQVKYNNEAIEKNVFIIGSCGFDSVPADMGVIFTQNKFKSIKNFCRNIELLPFNIYFKMFTSR